MPNEEESLTKYISTWILEDVKHYSVEAADSAIEEAKDGVIDSLALGEYTEAGRLG